MAKFKFIEENQQFKIESDEADQFINLNPVFHKTILSDVDLIIIKDDTAILMEYKNSSIPTAVNPQSFESSIRTDDHYIKIARKYLDSLIYLNNIDVAIANKSYCYVLETTNMDSVLRKRIAGKIKKKLPFDLQTELGLARMLIDDFKVLSIEEWNQLYSGFAFSAC